MSSATGLSAVPVVEGESNVGSEQLESEQPMEDSPAEAEMWNLDPAMKISVKVSHIRNFFGSPEMLGFSEGA